MGDRLTSKLLQDDEQLALLDRIRGNKKGRMTYDCFEAEYDSGSDQVLCRDGTPLSKQRFTLLQCLRGVYSGVCKDCNHYDDNNPPADEAFMNELFKGWRIRVVA